MVLIFLMASLLVGSGLTLVKRYHPDFAPGLPVEVIRKELDAPDTSSGFEPSLRLDETDEPADSEDLDEVIQKTEERIRGEYPEVRINISTASKRELMILPRIGPKMAERIIAYREANGPFQSKEEIMKVKGIGKKTFENLKELIVVE